MKGLLKGFERASKGFERILERNKNSFTTRMGIKFMRFIKPNISVV